MAYWDDNLLLLHSASTTFVTVPDLLEEEEMFITSGNWRGKDNSLSRYGGADQP